MLALSDLLELAERYNRELPAAPAALKPPQGAGIAAWIDHTLLKPEATAPQVKKLCQEAVEHTFASVCVNPANVLLSAESLSGSEVKVCSVVGFPFGATPATVKVFETLACIDAGATEIDMVINLGALKGQAYGQVYNEILALAQVCHNRNALLKVILEMAILTRQEKIIGCLISKAAGADFVKTSTGYGPGGATVEDVDIMYRVVGPQVKVKAAGGIRNLQTALAMVSAGASRLGASAGVQIVQEAVAQS
jgi:deoxyribose-phosphate aldolase